MSTETETEELDADYAKKKVEQWMATPAHYDGPFIKGPLNQYSRVYGLIAAQRWDEALALIVYDKIERP